MEEKKIKVVFRRGSIGLKIAVIAMVLLSMAALLTTWYFTQKTKQEQEALRQEAIEEDLKRSRLNQAIEKLGTVQSIIEIAKKELGLVEPDTIIIDTEQ